MIRVRCILLLALGASSVSAQQATVPKSTISRHLRTLPSGESLRVVRNSVIRNVAVASDTQVRLRPGEILVLRDRYVTLAANSSTLLNLSLRVSITGGGLRFDAGQNAFTGELLVGLDDSTRPRERIQLSGPLEVQVTGDAERVEPAVLRLTHTNVPFESVRLRARSPGDTLRVVVRPVFDPVGLPTGIPVIRPLLRIRASPARIEGFGLETATLTVSADEEFKGRLLVLSATRGRLDADTLRLSESGVAVTAVRSGGWGEARIEADVGSLAHGELALYYVFPWSFLVAGILGGAIGALVRMRRVGHRKGRSFAADMLLGSAAGLLAAIALALGVNLVGIDLNVRFGEAAVFLVAALGAALELPALARLRAKLISPRT